MTTGDSTSHQGGIVEIRSVSKSYIREGELTLAIEDVSFSVPEGSVVAIVGPSGSGKSTLLNMIAGLLSPTSGSVHYAGSAVTTVNRDVGYMTQHDSLLPWRTALSNVQLPLDIQRVPREEARLRARAALRDVGLTDFEKHYPSQLSGGMRKRVQLARTVVYNPRTLLMDEPFGALDAILRLSLQEEFLRVLSTRERPLTVVLVTHDLEEAVTMADQVVMLTSAPARLGHLERISGLREAALSDGVVDMRRIPAFGEYVNRLWQVLDSDGRDRAARAEASTESRTAS